jgi:biotin carboxylase
MKQNAILFIDVDDGEVANYNYREMHFSAAKELGFACLTVVLKNYKHLERVKRDSDKIFFIDKIVVKDILNLIPDIKQTYVLKTIFCNAGHASSDGVTGAVIAEVATSLGLKYSSIESIYACNNKFIMRHVLMEKGIKSSKFTLCSNLKSIVNQAHIVGFPLIAKPPFGAGSSFIKKCHNIDEVIAHYKHFTSNYKTSRMASFYGPSHEIKLNSLVYQYIPGKSILLEEYIDGIEGSVECIAYKNNVYPVIINEKLILEQKNSTVLENLLITPPSSFSKSEIQQIKNYAIECIKALGLDTAIIHFEFRLSKSGPIVIEVNPRLGGLYVNLAFHDIAKIDPYKLYLLMLLDTNDAEDLIKKSVDTTTNSTTPYSMLAIYPKINGCFKGFNGINYVKQHSQILDYDTYEVNKYVNAEVEENYLLKCWAKVHDKNNALNLYDEVTKHVIPIISKI